VVTVFNVKKSKITLFFIAFLISCSTSQASHASLKFENLFSSEKEKARPEKPLRAKEDVETIRILSVDGGAIRGMCPATILAAMEEQSGQSISEMFHVIGGTSVGCVLTSGLSMPDDPDQPVHLWKPKYTGRDLVNTIYTEAQNILRRRWIPFGSLYDVNSLEDVADRYFGNTTFDKSIIPTVGVTFDLIAAKNRAFCSWDKNEVFLRRDIVLASSAAPILFYPRVISPVNFNTPLRSCYFLTDGGIGAGNPAAIIIDQARKIYPKATRFEVVSLGVGVARDPLYYEMMRRPMISLMNLGSRFIDLGINLQSSIPEEYVEKLIVGHYTRINPIIPAANTSITDTSTEHLQALEKASLNYLEENADLFKKLIKRLKKPKD